MLFKLFCEKLERALGGTFASSSHLLSFAGVIFIGSPFWVGLLFHEWLLATYFDHLLRLVSMVCVTGLSTQPVATTYNPFRAVDLYALGTDWWSGLHDFLSGSLYWGSKSLSLRRSLELFRKALVEGGDSRSLKVLMRSIFWRSFLVEGLGAFLLSFRFIPWSSAGDEAFYPLSFSHFSLL